MIEAALLANSILFVAIALFLLKRGYVTIYSGLFVYLAFHFFAFVQRPIVVYLFDIRSEFVFMGYMPTETVFVQSIVISAFGLICFVLGYTSVLGFRPVPLTFQVPAVSRTEKSSFVIAFVLLFPAILYSLFMALTIRQFYGADVLDQLGQLNMTIDPTTGHQLFSDTTAYVVFARHMALPFATLFICMSRARWWSFLPLIFCGLISIQVGERWPLVISALVAMTIVLYMRRRYNFAARHYLMMCAILFVFVALGQNRELLVKFLLTGEVNFQFDLARSSFGAHPDFANFEYLTFIVGKVPDVSGTFSYFTQYLGLFTQPIPRVLWPEKPVGSPIMLVNLEAYGRFASRTTSLVGDGWISLGYLGVAVTLWAAGAAYGWLYRRFCRPGGSIYYFCAYFWIAALLLQWARDGGYKILDFYFFCLSPLILAYGINVMLLRARSRDKVLVPKQ